MISNDLYKSQKGAGVTTTISGKVVDILNPKPEDYRIDDIIHAQIMLCRFNGHVNQFYSVQRHILEGLRYFTDPIQRKQWFFHEASEPYIGDLIRPLKTMPEIKDFFDRVENTHLIAASKKFDFQFPFDSKVHEVDLMMGELEYRHFQLGEEVSHDFTKYSCMAPIELAVEAFVIFVEEFIDDRD